MEFTYLRREDCSKAKTVITWRQGGHIGKGRSCWCPKPIFWKLNSFLTQTLTFVPINLHRYWTYTRVKSEIGNYYSMIRRVPGPCTIAKSLGTNLPRETPRGWINETPLNNSASDLLFWWFFLTKLRTRYLGCNASRREVRNCVYWQGRWQGNFPSTLIHFVILSWHLYPALILRNAIPFFCEDVSRACTYTGGRVVFEHNMLQIIVQYTF